MRDEKSGPHHDSLRDLECQTDIYHGIPGLRIYPELGYQISKSQYPDIIRILSPYTQAWEASSEE